MKSPISIALYFLLSGLFLSLMLGAIERSRKLLGVAGACLVAVVCIIVFLAPVQVRNPNASDKQDGVQTGSSSTTISTETGTSTTTGTPTTIGPAAVPTGDTVTTAAPVTVTTVTTLPVTSSTIGPSTTTPGFTVTTSSITVTTGGPVAGAF